MRVVVLWRAVRLVRGNVVVRHGYRGVVEHLLFVHASDLRRRRGGDIRGGGDRVPRAVVAPGWC
jgi:hypothetical protein